MNVEIKILDKRLIEHGINYATPGASAIDLRACNVRRGDDVVPIEGTFVLHAGQTLMVGTGVAAHLGSIEEDGDPFASKHLSVASLILPRSGLGAKQGIVIGNLVGLCDADYQGEIIACIWNRTAAPFAFSALDRLAQMVIVPVLKPDFSVVEEFSNSTKRGTCGFGSTGV